MALKIEHYVRPEHNALLIFDDKGTHLACYFGANDTFHYMPGFGAEDIVRAQLDNHIQKMKNPPRTNEEIATMLESFKPPPEASNSPVVKGIND